MFSVEDGVGHPEEAKDKFGAGDANGDADNQQSEPACNSAAQTRRRFRGKRLARRRTFAGRFRLLISPVGIGRAHCSDDMS
jgi:hypothetical protein